MLELLDFVALLGLAFFMEMVDNSLGGGFGTILSPLLVILGYDAKIVVPAILVSEMISGLWGGSWHAKYHNVNWKAVGMTLIGSLVAMGLATYVMGTYLSPAMLKYVISVFAVVMGIFVVIRSYMVHRIEKMHLGNHPWLFSVMGFLIGYQKGTCYDEKTEILTKSGWKLFKDLKMEDEVACLSQDQTFYWRKPSALQKFSHKGKMIRINHSSVDLFVTPNHRLYLREQNSKKYEFVEAGTLDKYAYSTINRVKWGGEEKEFFELPKVDYQEQAHGQHIEKAKLKMDDWLRFLGWYISEGSVVQNHKDFIICLHQRKQGNIHEIKTCLSALGYKFSYQAKKDFRFYNKQLFIYLAKLGKADSKHIPQEFMNLSTRQLAILFDSLVKGDGHINKNGTTFYYSASKKLVDQVQELAMKLGKNSTVRMRDRIGQSHLIRGKPAETKSLSYEVSIRQSKETFMITKEVVSEEDYEGLVYCCSVPEHIILVRREGQSTWCSNSGGNYGPFSVTGYMVMGMSAAVAIGTTTIAEGIACTLGVAMYSQMTGIVLAVAAPLAIGAFIADPISAWCNNHLKNKLSPPFHGRVIGLAMLAVGVIGLLKTLGLV